MQVKTSRFGEIEVPDESLITFPEGVIGFTENTRFVIFDCGDEGIFKWLQSCERPELAFVIAEASLIFPSYQVIIGKKERELLQLEKVEDAATCLIMVIPDNPIEATANLLGPIIMNADTRLGMQIVLINPDYSTRYRVFAVSDDSDKEADNAGA